jgi:hypothetical protein
MAANVAMDHHGSWNLSHQEVLWSHATDLFYNVVPQLAL